MERQPSQADYGRANRLGALALAITDRVSETVSGVAGTSGTTSAALSALHHFLEAPSIDHLRQVLGLTHSGTVRLVDHLERDGYARRQAGPDGRSISVSLTAAGRRIAARISRARVNVLSAALDVLSDADREHFDHLLGQVLAGMKRGPGATRWICRMCDTGTCGMEAGTCPLGGASIRT